MLRGAFLCCLSLVVLGAADASLSMVRNIYLLPMAGSLDQYLANQLTRSGRYQVVTDPELADAVITDRLGQDFEQRLAELYPPPQPEATAPKPSDKDADEEAEEERSTASLLGEAGSFAARSGSIARSRGNVFLVDRTSKRVIWSVYERPRNTRPDELNRIAGEVVGQLKKDADREVSRMRREENKSVSILPPEPPPTAAPKPEPARAPDPAATAPPPVPAPAPAK